MENIRDDWSACFGGSAQSRAVVASIIDGYAQNGVQYHTIDHAFEVVHALISLHAAAGSVPSPEEHLAAWCHDVVYVYGASDNEERSALFAENAARFLGWSSEQAATTALLVLGTKCGHRRTAAQAMLADADLSTLAKPWLSYRSDTERLRIEAGADQATWRRSRKIGIEKFLAQPTIFTDETAIALWERAARSNLERELRNVAAPVQN